MEVLGAAGSIVGILGFIGQSIAGIAKLQGFFNDYKQAPHLTKKLRSDMTSLEATLMDVKAVIQHLEKQSWGEVAETVKVSIANLEGFAKQCSDDIENWIQVTAGLDPKRKSGLRAFFRKIKLAMSGPETLRSFEADVTRHRQNISSALATLTVNLVVKGHMSLGELNSKMDQFSENQMRTSKAIIDQLDHAAVMQPLSTTDNSAEEQVAHLLQDVHLSLESRFDALSEGMSLDRGQRDQEIRSLYASSQASTSGQFPQRPPTPSPMYGAHQHGSSWLTRGPRMSRSNAGSIDMASISSSLSSIAASLSALPRPYSPSYPGQCQTQDCTDSTGIGLLESAAVSSTEWACDALSGIDDAHVTSELNPHLELCLFCGERFTMKTLDDPYIFGKHLVDKHAFGQCDLNESFRTWAELRHHLQQFHSFDLSMFTSTDHSRFQRVKKDSSSKHPYYYDATGVSRDLQIYENNTADTDLKLQSELLELLVEAGVLQSCALSNPSFRPGLTCAIRILNITCRDPTYSDQDLRVKYSNKAAMIEEQLIVAGYTSAIHARQCPDLPYLNYELRAGCLGPRDRSKWSHNDDIFFSNIWTKADAMGRYYSGSLDRDHLYRICSRCGDKVLSWVGDAHPTASTQHCSMVWPEPTQSPYTVVAVPRGLHASLVTMQAHCGSTLAHRISKWMMVAFFESASQRELLRTSPLITTHPLIRKEGGGGSANDATEGWVVPILRFWNQDGLPVTDEPSGYGVGNPYSRGTFGEGGEPGLRSPSSPAMCGDHAATKFDESVLATMDYDDDQDEKSREQPLLLPMSEPLSPTPDGGVDGRSASPNSAIWSREDEPRPARELGKRAASPSPLFEFTAGPKRIKI